MLVIAFLTMPVYAATDIWNVGSHKIDSAGAFSTTSTGNDLAHIEVFTTGDTLVAGDSGKYIVTNLEDDDGIVDFVLPSVATAGLQYKFVSSHKSIIRIDPASSDQIMYASLAAGDRIASGTAASADGVSGDSITLVSDGSHWLVTEMVPIDWADAN
jgi:hypothetical protein